MGDRKAPTPWDGSPKPAPPPAPPLPMAYMDSKFWERKAEEYQRRAERAEAGRDTLKAALQAAEQFLHVGVSRGPAVNGWQNTVDLVAAALAACVPPQEK